MIAIDTNVLLRYLLQDDKQQAEKANKIIKSHESVLVSDVVLVETIWTLAGKRYKLDPEAIAGVIRSLFEEPTLFFQDPTTVWRALSDFQMHNVTDAGSVGFPDSLALNAAKSTAALMGESFAGFYTFDAAAQKMSGARAP